MADFITPKFDGFYDTAVYSKPAGFVTATGIFDPIGVPAGLGAAPGLGTSSLLGPLLGAGLLFILASRPRSVGSGRCTASGYTTDSATGLCYRLYTSSGSPISITAARAQCQNDGGRVLLVDNAAKLNFAQQQAASAGINGVPINGIRANDASPWTSFEGNLLTFLDWNTGEPNNGDIYIGVPATTAKMEGGDAAFANFFQGYICEIP